MKALPKKKTVSKTTSKKQGPKTFSKSRMSKESRNMNVNEAEMPKTLKMIANRQNQ